MRFWPVFLHRFWGGFLGRFLGSFFDPFWGVIFDPFLAPILTPPKGGRKRGVFFPKNNFPIIFYPTILLYISFQSGTFYICTFFFFFFGTFFRWSLKIFTPLRIFVFDFFFWNFWRNLEFCFYRFLGVFFVRIPMINRVKKWPVLDANPIFGVVLFKLPYVNGFLTLRTEWRFLTPFLIQKRGPKRGQNRPPKRGPFLIPFWGVFSVGFLGSFLNHFLTPFLGSFLTPFLTHFLIEKVDWFLIRF